MVEKCLAPHDAVKPLRDTAGMTEAYDVITVGGGPAGAALAKRLAEKVCSSALSSVNAGALTDIPGSSDVIVRCSSGTVMSEYDSTFVFMPLPEAQAYPVRPAYSRRGHGA
jgi:hypothetical protein